MAVRFMTVTSTLRETFSVRDYARVLKEPVLESRSLEALPSGRGVVTQCPSCQQVDRSLTGLEIPFVSNRHRRFT
jgi:hypothetical protein